MKTSYRTQEILKPKQESKTCTLKILVTKFSTPLKICTHTQFKYG